MLRRSMTLWLLLATLAGITLFVLKHEVQKREDRLTALTSQILDDQEAIQVLKAEWSYLNRPERLERLIHELETTKPASGLQLATIDMLPQSLNADGAPTIDNAVSANGIVLPVPRPVSLRTRR